MLTEKQVYDWLAAQISAGAKRRRTGEPTPHSGQSVQHMLECVGWVQEDLRLALKAADPVYKEQQERFGQ